MREGKARKGTLGIPLNYIPDSTASALWFNRKQKQKNGNGILLNFNTMMPHKYGSKSIKKRKLMITKVDANLKNLCKRNLIRIDTRLNQMFGPWG